jgi:glycerol kinase
MQFLADVCALPVLRPDYREMTALGAAAAAAMQLGWTTAADWAARAVPGKRFEPGMKSDVRAGLLKGWDTALGRALA